MMQDNNQQSQVNSNKLYFGNLPWSINDDRLAELVAEFGETVDVKVIADFNTGRSKGFGFVEFTNEEDAKKAMEALNETEIDGRNIFVKVARPKTPRGDRSGGGYRRDGRNNDRGYNRNDRGSRRDY